MNLFGELGVGSDPGEVRRIRFNFELTNLLQLPMQALQRGLGVVLKEKFVSPQKNSSVPTGDSG